MATTMAYHTGKKEKHKYVNCIHNAIIDNSQPIPEFIKLK